MGNKSKFYVDLRNEFKHGRVACRRHACEIVIKRDNLDQSC